MKILSNSQRKFRSHGNGHHKELQFSDKPLGAILQRAGLITSQQVQIALQRQERECRDRRLGEILALQGWLKPQTADFFAERWSNVIQQQPKQPLGHYLKEAALLNEFQIEAILFEQGRTNLKFGELAVRKGWLEPTTRDFFVENLTFQPKFYTDISSISDEVEEQHDESELDREIRQRFLKIRLKLFGLDENSFPLSLLEEILVWTSAHIFLTQKLCQLAAESDLTVGEESRKIEDLVKTRIVTDWQQGAAAEHLLEIRDCLLHNRQCDSVALLKEYRRIYCQQSEFCESKEQTELIDLGLVRESRGKLKVSNQIYREVFNLVWLEQQLSSLSSRQSEPTTHSNSFGKRLATAKANVRQLATDKVSSRNRPTSLLFLAIFVSLSGLSLPYLHQRWQIKSLFGESTELLRAGKERAAIAGYDRLLKIDSNYYQAWTNRGYALSGLKEYEQMLASCSSATLIEPEAVYAWNCMGEALYNLQRNAAAVTAFERASELSPNDSVFFINKSEALIALKRYDEAIAASKRAVEILSDREQNEGRSRVARELAIAWNYHGKSLLEGQQYREAIAAYNNSLEYIEQYFPARIGKGIALKNLQQYRLASNLFASILKEDLDKTQKATAWFYLGKTLCESSQIFSGTAAFDEALELKPNYEAAVTAKANCSQGVK